MVAGDAGDVLHHCGAPADEPVDQGRLADVRPADDGEHGERGGRAAVVVLVAALEESEVVVLELVLRQARAQRVLT